MTDQLPLPFIPRPDFSTLPFIRHPGAADAQAWLTRADWPRLALWGDAGAGKSHLLHRWAAGRGAVVAGPGLSWPDLSAPGGAGPIAPGLLAIDDADQAPVLALLHTLNTAAEAGVPVLLAAREPPGRWPVTLPDLHSRLYATIAVRLHAPDDDARARLFCRLLDDRQLVVSPALQAWLLTRLPRDPAALRDAAARLDHAALAAQRAPTRATAASALAPLLAPLDDDNSMDDTCGCSLPEAQSG